MLCKENLQAAFTSFDADSDGFITIDERKLLIGNIQVMDKVWEDVLREVDADGNGKIDIKEFIELMLRTF